MKNHWLIRVGAILAACALALLAVVPVAAPWGWCEVDPVLSVDGHELSIDIAIQGDPAAIQDGMKAFINLPGAADVSLISSDSNVSTRIVVNHGVSEKARVSVKFDTRENYPAKLTITLDGNQVAVVEGTTQNGIDCKFGLSY